MADDQAVMPEEPPRQVVKLFKDSMTRLDRVTVDLASQPPTPAEIAEVDRMTARAFGVADWFDEAGYRDFAAELRQKARAVASLAHHYRGG